MKGGFGIFDFGIFQVGFCTENLFVVRSCSGFSVVFAKNKAVYTFLCGSLCSQMLGYFTSFYFTVNPGQTVVCDSGFLIDIYSYRGAFYKRKISLIVLYCYSIEDLCDRFFGELFFKFTVWSLFSRYRYNVWHLDQGFEN